MRLVIGYWTGRRWKEIPPPVIEAMKLDFIELTAFRGFRKAVRVDSYGPLAFSAGGTESKSTSCDAVEFALSLLAAL
jgi:hypothetical protein